MSLKMKSGALVVVKSFENPIIIKYPWLTFFFCEEMLDKFIVPDVLFASH